ncbi:MAG: biopolymer transporter ExbD [Candidatus Omnitrophica bacterium]|nr:biopolymer transporter ExbD [Candidatus Omnitrophota bacterium]
MKRTKKHEKIVAEINITPFTDVILVLLIIFMITTPLISYSNIKVNLPEVKSKSLNDDIKQTQADITISREGVVYLGGKVVTKKELKERMKTMHKEHSDLIVVVRADKFVRFQSIVEILDPLNEIGITRLNIAVLKDK